MVTQKLTADANMHGFTLERCEPIEELRSEAAVFRHEKTGARVVHLFNDDANNLFCIGFRTPVYNNTGVPHILEHSVLSGSRKFPLKDPFKELLKGSLQTFLNAMTYPDKTIYPVSSQVEADFFNLVDVYCDAVFYPLLTETTFRQEGWHYDLERPDSLVNIKGIVYNEMKGVFSDFRSHVARKALSHLMPNTTYYYESGGEPESIPELTYEQFKDFHRRYYHPSNAFIFLYGNIESAKTLAFLDERYLSGFERKTVDSEVRMQQAWDAPRKAEILAPCAEEDDGTASVVMAWMVGESSDPEAALVGRILARYLLGTESSPLKRALIDSGLGEDLDDMSGFDSDLAQGIFAAGLRKTKPEHAKTINKLILDTLERQVAGGLDEELLEGALRQVEFGLREIAGGHFPYNLKLAERAYRSWIYGGDPLAHLRFETPLRAIKARRAERAGYFAARLKELFLDNQHQLLMTVIASAEQGKKLARLTEEQASLLSAEFTDEDRRRHWDLTQKLIAEQKKPPSPEALATIPRLHKQDLPPRNETVPTEGGALGETSLYAHPLFTSGIVYFDIGFDCRAIPMSLYPYLSLYLEMMTRCGAANDSYEQMARRISLNTGGVSSSSICVTRAGGADELENSCMFHSKSLGARFDDMLGIMHDFFTKPRLRETKVLKDALYEMRNDLNASVVRSGHSFAVNYAASRLVKSRYVDEILDGITQLRFLDTLIKGGDFDLIGDALERVHALVVNRARSYVSLIADRPGEYTARIERFLEGLPSRPLDSSPMDFEPAASADPRGVEISSSVNYVAQVWPLQAIDPVEAGQYALIARNLSTGYLWERVRVEGGAYGGMAMADSSHPLFACASYRDPNCLETLDAFRAGLELLAEGLPADDIDQSIIGTIGKIDRFRTPHSKGLGETLALRAGKTPEFRQRLRESILTATPETVARRARAILDNPVTEIAIVGNASAFDTAEKTRSLRREKLLG
jgi:Zn-dependent M16 (insulinase) family peptidase